MNRSDGPRINVIGSSGAGKTTTGRLLARRLGLEFVELDSLYHGPDWTPATPEDFRKTVEAATSGDSWVVDGNYNSVAREIIWQRATHVIWVDMPRFTVMWQVIARSTTRAIRRAELWNGNRESFLRWFSLEHPIAWAWRTHGSKRKRDEVMLGEPRWAHLDVVRLSNRKQRDLWVQNGSLP